jgi:azurin
MPVMTKQIKIFYVVVIAGILFSTACGHTEDNTKKESVVTQPADSAETTVPGVDKLPFTDTIHLKAGNEMRFDQELFRIRTGKKIRLTLTNTAAKSNLSMTHNVVVLAKGTDIADFADAVHNAKDEQYVPASVAPLVIAHTGMVAGGDSGEVEFTISKPGVYDYICSFPGHWGTMQGKIVAE